MSSMTNDFLVMAANIACESGVPFSPDVSFTAPRPRQSVRTKPVIASTG
jgi:hypothetical protein